MFSTIKSFDGTELYYAKDTIDNPKAVIVIVHGISEHLGRYEYTKDKLLSFGYNVYRFDHRGHGKSGGKRGHMDSYKDLIKDTDVIVELAKKENPDIPIFMIGHSMGGFVTACYGVLFPNKLNGQIFSGAATNSIPFSLKIKSIKLSYLIRGMVPNRLSKLMCTVPEIVEGYENDPLVLKETTLKFNNEFINKGIPWLISQYPKYKYPCLILHGGDDKIVPKECSEKFYKYMSSTDKELKIYDGLYHEILSEDIKDSILDEIHKWIEKRI